MNEHKVILQVVQSIDGKISTGTGISRGIDNDYNSGSDFDELARCYEEQSNNATDWVLLDGSYIAHLYELLGMKPVPHEEFKYVILDTPELDLDYVKDFIHCCNAIVFITNDDSHVITCDNISTIVSDPQSPVEWLGILRDSYGVQSITAQVGGDIGATLLRSNCVDVIDMYILPVVIGGKSVHTMADGRDIETSTDLSMMRYFKMTSSSAVGDVMHLVYERKDN